MASICRVGLDLQGSRRRRDHTAAWRTREAAPHRAGGGTEVAQGGPREGRRRRRGRAAQGGPRKGRLLQRRAVEWTHHRLWSIDGVRTADDGWQSFRLPRKIAKRTHDES